MPRPRCIVADVLLEQGCPDRIRLGRDTCWLGSWTAKDFPSPILRFLHCLGIEPCVCPPKRPDNTVPVSSWENPFVERYHRSFKYECQLIEKPTDLSSTVEVNWQYVHFYNFERPNQAITCGDQPPYVKFLDTPSLTPVQFLLGHDIRKQSASINNLVIALIHLIHQANFQNAAQARRWFAAHLLEAFALFTTLFHDLGKAIIKCLMLFVS